MTTGVPSVRQAGAGDGIVFFLDVDNTLFNNDQFKTDLEQKLSRLLGSDQASAFWALYESVREEQSYVDYPLTIRRFAQEGHNPEVATTLTALLEGMPFSSYVYTGAFEAVAYLKTLGTPVILSDGDQEFQPFKIRRSGLEQAVQGRVLITIHKEQELDDVFRTYPASHYVVVDDKPRILAALEACCPAQVTTVFVKQGKYAVAGVLSPPPDITLERVGALQGISRDDFLHGSLAQRETR